MSTLPFLSAYDPLGGLGGSIDPLGTLRVYGALVDLILPGMSTITTRSRYLSMLCAAFTNVTRAGVEIPAGSVGIAVRRRAIEPYERLWALACARAKQRGRPAAAEGLRGIRSAERKLAVFEKREQNPTDFRMLKSQSRTGGVATYWTTLLSGDLLTEEGRLTVAGERLAKEFPNPDGVDLLRLANPVRAGGVPMSLDALERWGDESHLGAARVTEQRLLVEALRSNDRRDHVANALETYARERTLPTTWMITDLRRLREHVARDERAAKLDIPDALDAAIEVERFHEAALVVFETLLWWGTTHAELAFADLVKEGDFRSATETVRARGAELERLAASTAPQAVRRLLEDLAQVAADLTRRPAPRDVVDGLLRRHSRVQAGKIDGGGAKQDWLTLAPGDRVVRPAVRYQRLKRPAPATGDRLTHPYRLEEFIGMLRENSALAAGSAAAR